jgi:hypothetical protein
MDTLSLPFSYAKEVAMLRVAALFVSLAAFLAPILTSVTAHAQATRTWVAGTGDDGAVCSRTAPCKTFAAALAKTSDGGEINCLDSAGFGNFTITKSVTILCNGVVGGVLAADSDGIVINNATPTTLIRVTLDGLDIEGVGTGLDGVRILVNAKVTIKNSRIRNFGGTAVKIVGPAGARVIIEDSLIAGNNAGVSVGGIGGAANAALLYRTTVDNNAAFSTSVAAGSVLLLNGATLGGSAIAIKNPSGATVTSAGNNFISGSGLPTVTNALK